MGMAENGGVGGIQGSWRKQTAPPCGFEWVYLWLKQKWQARIAKTDAMLDGRRATLEATKGEGGL